MITLVMFMSYLVVCKSFAPQFGGARSAKTLPEAIKGAGEEFDSRRPLSALLAALQVASCMLLPISALAATAESAAVPPAVVAAAPVAKGPLEETWDFTNKFFLDRTHNNHDWDVVHDEFTKRAASDRGKELELTREMLKLLGDRYSRLVDPSVYAALSRFDMLGAGVMLSPNKAGQLAVASAPSPGSAAAKKGVNKGDLVTAINGRPTVKMTSFDVIDFLSKYTGGTVSFELQTPAAEGAAAAPAPRTVVLDRTFQAVKNPVYYELQERGDGHKIGYMAVSEFNSVVTERTREAIAALTAAGADEFVLDLRGNGGGAFQSALGLAGLFMDESPITQVVDGNGKKVGFRSDAGAAVTRAPLAVWINRGSASASEVLAGALHDDCRAVLVGSRSFGKGLIQAVYGLTDGSGLILTVARYETPRGTDIQGSGITPDVRIPWPAFMPGVGKKVPQEVFELAAKRGKTCAPLPISGQLAAGEGKAAWRGDAAAG